MSIRSNRSAAAAERHPWRDAESPDIHDGPAPRAAMRPLTLVSSELKASFTSTRDRRQGGPSQDQALYACACGCQFEALVSTSVGCPRCGGIQAW